MAAAKLKAKKTKQKGCFLLDARLQLRLPSCWQPDWRSVFSGRSTIFHLGRELERQAKLARTRPCKGGRLVEDCHWVLFQRRGGSAGRNLPPFWFVSASPSRRSIFGKEGFQAFSRLFSYTDNEKLKLDWVGRAFEKLSGKSFRLTWTPQSRSAPTSAPGSRCLDLRQAIST